MNQNTKRVCVINVKPIIEGEETIFEGERVMRVTRAYAQELINTGVWQPTTKGKLKSYLNRNLKLAKNMRKIETMQKLTGETFGEKKEGKKGRYKTYVEIPTASFKRAIQKVDENGEGIKSTTEFNHPFRNGNPFRKAREGEKVLNNGFSTGTEKRVVAYP